MFCIFFFVELVKINSQVLFGGSLGITSAPGGGAQEPGDEAGDEVTAEQYSSGQLIGTAPE